MHRTELLICQYLTRMAVVGFLLGVCGMTCAEDAVPAAFPTGRYDAVRAHCPFGVATAEAPPAPVEINFASNWFVSGVGKTGDDDYVTIKARDQSKQFSLFGKNDEFDGVRLASVNWSDLVGKTTVILKKGTETAKLEFNEQEIHAAPAAPAPGTPGGAGAPPPVAGGKTPPMQNLGQRSPSRMPNTPAIGIPGQVMPPVPGQEIRRRPQVIQPPQ
jgi:hypothetical protein